MIEVSSGGDSSGSGQKQTLRAKNEMRRYRNGQRRIAVVLYVGAMAAVIVGVDFVFFRNRSWERLIVNIGIVLVFGAFYLRFLMPPYRKAQSGHHNGVSRCLLLGE